jgi:ATP-dependent DNA helicase RecG
MMAPGMDFLAPVQFAKGVGPQRSAALAKAGIRTVEDLLYHVPTRYEDRRQLAKIADLRPGMKVSVAGVIAVAGLRRARRMTLYEARIEDETGRVKALWFNQSFLKDVLPRGARVVLYGLVERDSYGGRTLLMPSPQFEIQGAEDEAAAAGRRPWPSWSPPPPARRSRRCFRFR